VIRALYATLALAAALLPVASFCQRDAGRFANWDNEPNRADPSWTKEKWTGNNQPWRAMRTELDNVVKTQVARKAELIAAAEAAFTKHPNDAKLLYRWAYLAYRFGIPNGKVSADTEYRLIRSKFLKVKSPQVPEYTRARFLIEAWHLAGSYYSAEHLTEAADRLIACDPNDRTVKFLYAWLQVASRDLSRIDKALGYLDAVQRHNQAQGSPYPEALEYYRALLYWSRHSAAKRKADAESAIAAFERYKETVKINKMERERVDRGIAAIKKQAGL
jgi:hypothetical protein